MITNFKEQINIDLKKKVDKSIMLKRLVNNRDLILQVKMRSKIEKVIEKVCNEYNKVHRSKLRISKIDMVQSLFELDYIVSLTFPRNNFFVHIDSILLLNVCVQVVPVEGKLEVRAECVEILFNQSLLTDIKNKFCNASKEISATNLLNRSNLMTFLLGGTDMIKTNKWCRALINEKEREDSVVWCSI